MWSWHSWVAVKRRSALHPFRLCSAIWEHFHLQTICSILAALDKCIKLWRHAILTVSKLAQLSTLTYNTSSCMGSHCYLRVFLMFSAPLKRIMKAFEYLLCTVPIITGIVYGPGSDWTRSCVCPGSFLAALVPA